MGRRFAFLLLLALSITSAVSTGEDLYGINQVDGPDGLASAEAITIKLVPVANRKKGDVRAVLERLKALPELQGASMAAASRGLLVLIPSAKHNTEELKNVLLKQPEVYELEIGEELYRREGDKPYDQLRKEKLAEVLSQTKTKIQGQLKDRLLSLLKKRKRDTGGAPASAAAAGEAVRGKKRRGKGVRAAERAGEPAEEGAAHRVNRRRVREVLEEPEL